MTASVLLALALPAPSLGQDLVSLRGADRQTFRIKTFAPATDNCRGIAVLSHGAAGRRASRH